MNTIELRLRKKTVFPFTIVIILALVLGTSVVFFKDEYNDNLLVKIASILVSTYVLYLLYPTIKKTKKHEPVIILKENEIILNNEKAVLIARHEIQNIEVIYVQDSGYFLSIKTEKENYQTNVSWLDKTPDQIKELITRYN